MKIGLSGTGRIGRLCIRKLLSTSGMTSTPNILGAPNQAMELAVINSTSPIATLAHLLKYDSVHGTWDAEVSYDETGLMIEGRHLPVVSERCPEKIKWSPFHVDLVIDATGKFNTREGAEMHLRAGAEKVLITAPGSDMDLTVVMGVNEQLYQPDRHRLLSTASCTTNCLAPILHLLDEAFGVQRGWVTTIHSYTSDQKHLDNPHKDLRRARSCTSSIIPTTTGVGKALTSVLPHLAPHIEGIAVRVPAQNVSLLDLQVQLAGECELGAVRERFQQAAQGPLGKYVGYNELPLVSADYIGNEKSATVDGLSMILHGNQLKLLAWYDNEWAYACRVVDFAMHIAKCAAGQTTAIGYK